MDALEKRNLDFMINTIKNKNLLEIILKDDELNKGALAILNLNIPSSSEEINIDSILKNQKYREQIQNKIGNEIVNKIDSNYHEKMIETSTLKKEVEIKKNELFEIESDLKKIEKEKLKLKNEILGLEETWSEYQLTSKELENIKIKVDQDRKKRYDLQNEVSDYEQNKLKLLKEIENIKSQKKDLEIDLTEEAKRIKKYQDDQKKMILTSYENEIAYQKKKLLQELEEIQENRKNILDEVDSLRIIKEKYEEELNRIKDEKSELLEKEKELKLERKRLDILKEEIENFNSKLKEIKEEIEEEVLKRYDKKLSDLEDDFEKEVEENRELKKSIRKLEKITENTLEMAELEQINIDLMRKNEELKNKVLGKDEERANRIKSLESEKLALENKIQDLINEKDELSREKIELLGYRESLESVERSLPILERSKECLIKALEKKEEEIADLKRREQSEEAKKEAIEQIYFEDTTARETIDENIWLEEIRKSFKEVGFVFSRRLLYAFHTSLKIADWSSLSILAGVSGTGKSELPKLYSRYGGINFLPLAVQPNWDSPHSLFGYYNSLEGKFNATSLLKVLYQAQKNVPGSINDYLTIVLLDEMNLAHVELYFSELLSKLELLRGKSEGVDLEIDISEDKPYKINLNNSIMWVGTMNEDETTKSLSDKVVDRGNLISFPKPKKLLTRSKLVEKDAAPRLRRKNWEDWKWSEDKEDKISSRLDALKEVVEKMNEALDISGRAIGHRVWQSIENYIKNYPLVLLNLDNESELDKYMKIAFEDALVQKLMPKLRGLETSGDIRESCLNKIKEIIDINANGISKDFEIALENPYGVFVWSSSSYLEEDI
ncbi:MAG: hypothetical protein ACRCW7_07445 [Cetobacterium sp.]